MTVSACQEQRHSSQAGLTLIELMIAMVITSIAVSAALGVGYMMMNNYGTHKTMIAVERSARASMEFVSKAVRNASVAVPEGNIQDLVGCSTFGAFQVTNSKTGPDSIEVIYGAGGVLTSLRADYQATSNAMTVLDGSEFRAGDYALVTDGSMGHLVPITAVASGAGVWTLSTGAPSGMCSAVVFPAGGYKATNLVIRARISRMYVENSAATGNMPVFMFDPDGGGPARPEPIAEGIEDLQIAVGFDLNGDNIIDASDSSTDEVFFNHASDAIPPLLTVSRPRAMQITVVARSVDEDSRYNLSTRPPIADRPGASTPDPFRRRILRTVVELRNVEGSPL